MPASRSLLTLASKGSNTTSRGSNVGRPRVAGRLGKAKPLPSERVATGGLRRKHPGVEK